MSRKSKWFLGAACAAMLVAMTRTLPGDPVGDRVTDFSAGLAAAFMLGVLAIWRDRQV